MGSSKKYFLHTTIDLAYQALFFVLLMVVSSIAYSNCYAVGKRLTNSKRFVSERACNILFLLIFLLP